MRSMYMTSYMYIYSFKICFHIERASHNRSLLDHAKLRICITWCLSGTILKSHLSKYRERERVYITWPPSCFLAMVWLSLMLASFACNLLVEWSRCRGLVFSVLSNVVSLRGHVQCMQIRTPTPCTHYPMCSSMFKQLNIHIVNEACQCLMQITWATCYVSALMGQRLPHNFDVFKQVFLHN